MTLHLVCRWQVRCAFLGLLAGGFSVALAQDFTDGDFGNWGFDQLAVAGSSARAEVLGNGGNPDRCLQWTTVSGLALGRGVNNAATWNPATQGAISNVSMAIDVKSITGWGDGQTIQIVIVQDGKWFANYPHGITGSETWWHTVNVTDIAAEGFSQMTGPGNYDLARHPNFTVGGKQMTFGFAIGNSISRTYTQLYDNWRIFLEHGPLVVLKQITRRGGGGPCTNCCGIDHRQPILSPDGSRFVFSSTWNVDDFVGNLNPERNRELFSYYVISNTFQQLTITAEGMSLPYSYQAGKIGFVSCSPELGSNTDTNADVFGFDWPTATVSSWVNTTGPAPVDLGTNCPQAWFGASDWATLANLHVDVAADQRHIVWASSRNLPSVGNPAGDNGDGNYEIYWKDVVSGATCQITHTLGGDDISRAGGANLWPEASADGSRIVFVSNRPLGGPPVSSNRSGLFLAATNGSVQRLGEAEIMVERDFPPFGTDAAGTRIVFAAAANPTGGNEDRNMEIFAMTLPDGTLTQVTDTGASVTNSRPILSGDGLKVAFLSDADLNGSNPDGSEELWVFHFDEDRTHTNRFVLVTQLSATPVPTEGRGYWMDWYSMDHEGSQLVFCSNGDFVGENPGHAYELFLATFAWDPFPAVWLTRITKPGGGDAILEWDHRGRGLRYTVEQCNSLSGGAWQPAPPTNQWPILGKVWTNTATSGEKQMFFRVRARQEL